MFDMFALLEVTHRHPALAVNIKDTETLRELRKNKLLCLNIFFHYYYVEKLMETVGELREKKFLIVKISFRSKKLSLRVSQM